MRKYHHVGIPTATVRDGEVHLPELVKTTPHVAFEVDDLDAELAGKEILIEPNCPSPGVRVAFIVDNGAPIELMEIDPDCEYSADKGERG